MKRLWANWKEFSPFIFSLAVGCVAALIWIGSPGNKQARDFTLTFLGLAVIAMVAQLIQRWARTRVRAAGDGPPAAVSGASLTLANSNVDELLRAEQLQHPETITLPLEIRPSPRNGVAPLWLGFAATVGLVIYTAAKFHVRGQGLWIAGVVAMVLGILVWWFRWRYFSGTFLFVDQQEAGLVPAFGKRKAISRAGIRNIALRLVTYGRSPVKRLVVVGTDGRALLALNGQGFSAADASLFAAALRVPVDASWQPVSPGELAHEIPGAVSGISRHPMVVGAVMVVVFFIGFLLLEPHLHH